MPLTAVHLLNTDVVPFFEEHGVPIKTVLSDNGREFCGRPERAAPVSPPSRPSPTSRIWSPRAGSP